ncbi:ABC transporter substrate-binding protein [Klebsiella spallanzanii]|uniref:Glutamine-binding periplasmic protein n=1 Tax=Klebsiella spallanzanii TaxID=2587528 RepID=A0A564M2S4_9ENTR|nr:ABC transporter substrate-binding protein [Klebsiella spallanzanii]VUS88074.1 Glutamine-binding periplasmic protein [Klebsiella spallanzanii]
MKRNLSLRYLATALVLASGLVTAANAADATLTPGKLKIAMEVAYPPFESWQDDKIVGFDAELAALLSQKAGLTLQLVDTKFSSLILGLSGGRQDAVISALYITEERTQQADAIPYAKTGAYIMVRSDSKVAPQTENELCGLTIGLQQGTSWVKKLHELSASYCQAQGKGAIEIKEFPTAPETLQALLSGNIQAQVDIAGVVSLFTQRSKGRLKVSSPQTIYPQTLGIYIKKGNQALAQQLASALKTLRENGEYSALLKKYAAYGITDDTVQ